MKKIVLSLTVICAAFISSAQITVSGVSPASIVANYDFTWANNWGATPNFNIPGTFVEDTLQFVETGQTGLNAQGNPISREGCANLTNAASLVGKIAVIYRNECEFGAKALRAKNAGAVGVIIINRDNETIPMGGGASGSTVDIPVVMISSSAGLALKNEMLNGPVVIFMGNKAGKYANDLAIGIKNALIPKMTAVPTQLAQNGTEFNFDIGVRAYNFGTSTLDSVRVNAIIKDPSGATIYDHTVGPFTLSGVVAAVIDSVDIDPTSTMTFPNFNQATYPSGKYTLTYSIEDGDSIDDFMEDNMFSTSFSITNNLISYAKLGSNNVPVADNFYRSSTATQSYSSCIAFKDSNASRLGVDGFYFSATTNSVLNPSIEGEQLSYFVYKWNNEFTNLDDPDFPANDNYFLESVGFGTYLFEADLQDTTLYSPLDQQIILEDNQRYLFCVQTYADSIYLGHDTKSNYDWNVGYYLEAVNPVESNSEYAAAGFGGDAIPSIGIKVFNAEEIGIKEINTISGIAYPNPANDKVSISVTAKGNGQLTITDVSGRIAYTGTINLNSGNAEVNISGLKSGMYIFNVLFENGQNTKFNVVKN